MAEVKILIAVNPSWTETEVLSFFITVCLNILLSHIIAVLKGFELADGYVVLADCDFKPGICILTSLSKES